MSRAVSGPTVVGIPHGDLQMRHGRLTLRLERERGLTGVGALVEAFRSLHDEVFLVPDRLDGGEREVIATFPAEPPGTVSLREAWPSWHLSLPKCFPQIFTIAAFLDRAASALDALDIGDVVLAPVQVRYCPNRCGPWRLALFPTRTSSLEELADADEDLWLWTSGAFLLGLSEPSSINYSIAAATYTSIVGDPFPSKMPPDVRLRFILQGRFASAARLRAVVTGALPRSFAAEVDALIRLVMRPLDPDHECRPTRSEWTEELSEVCSLLSAKRVATRWEHEGAHHFAQAILEQAVTSATSDHAVPWDTISRLRLAGGDIEGAVDAHTKALSVDGRHAVSGHIGLLRRLAASSETSDRTDLLGRAVDVLDASGLSIGDVHRLHVANLEARRLGRRSSSLHRLIVAMPGRREEGVRRLMRARLMLESDAFIEASAEVKAGLEILNGAPEDWVAQLRAYLHYLDGVANFGGVGLLGDLSYLGDSFSALVEAHTWVTRCESCEELRRSIVRWLGWIWRCANQLGPQTQVVKTGVEAFLSVHNLLGRVRGSDHTKPPHTIWFDLDDLVPLSDRAVPYHKDEWR